MSLLRRIVDPSIPLMLVMLGGLTQGCAAEDAVPAAADASSASQTPAAQPAADDPYALPAGDAAVLLSFIEGLANPTQDFATDEEAQQHLERASTAIAAAADQILAGRTTGAQAVDAMEWKVEALRIREVLGEQDADQRRDEFLDRMLRDPRPDVAGMVALMRLVPQLRPQQWIRLDASQRAQAVSQYVADVKAAGPTVKQAVLLLQFSDMLADARDSDLALRAIDALLPMLAASADPHIQQIASSLEGIARRISLPGSKIELEGTLMDGTQLDWESYRGKVVLVDFWASWCGPCRREVPNVLANYRAYHDKGFEVLGICLDEDRGEAEQYIEEAGVVWPSLFSDDPKARGWDHPMAEKYGVSGVPRAILVDQDGRVVNIESQSGIPLGMMARGPLLGAQLRQLLGEPAPDESSAARPASEIRTASETAPTAP